MQYKARVGGMDCPSCAAKIERAVTRIDDVDDVQVDVTTGRLVADIDEESRARLESAVRSLGYTIEDEEESSESRLETPNIWKDRRLISVVAGTLLLLAALGARHLLGMEAIGTGLFVAAIVAGGYFVFRNAIGSIRVLHMDINILMTVAVVGAVILGEWFEAVTVVVLFAFAEWLEGASMVRARGAIRGLMELTPDTARVRRDGEEITVPVKGVSVGEVVIVKPGEKLPVDGTVVAGSSDVDQAPITGESKPVSKHVDDEVFAGTLNQRGSLEIRVDHAPDDTTLARVVAAIEDAQSNRSQSERFVEIFARYYTPAVMALAVVIALVPPLVFGGAWETWFYRSLVLLVIACPCALVLATPITTVSGLARAARDGILVKGGRFLEELGRVKVVAFDKTGTLTRGRAKVNEFVCAIGIDEHRLFAVAALAESRSEHYLARAIVDAALERGWRNDAGEVVEFEAHVGKGVEARVREVVSEDDNREQRVLVGNRRFLEEHGLDLSPLAEAWDAMIERDSSVVGVARAGELLGVIGIADRPREGAKEALAELREAGVEEIFMLTGDNERSAASIARELGIDDEHVLARLLPAEKVARVEELTERYRHVAMVGDGVNDAPALAASSVGIAMGAAGTDIALDTADVALMADDLSKLPHSIRLGERTVELIIQNIVLAIGIKVVILGLAAFGYATLWLAILADMGASLLVIFNGMRLLRET